MSGAWPIRPNGPSAMRWHSPPSAAMEPPELGPGEEARWFSTGGESWSGRAGWEIVKDGRVVRRIVRLMS